MPEHLHAVDDQAADGSSRTQRIRVVLADDHASLRRILRRLLDRDTNLEVVGEASDLESAIRAIRAGHPEVLVLDMRIPGGSSSERIERVHEQSPDTKIVIVTMHENQMYADQALKAGAIGFVLKDTADRELCVAVQSAAHGVEYRSPRLRRP